MLYFYKRDLNKYRALVSYLGQKVISSHFALIEFKFIYMVLMSKIFSLLCILFLTEETLQSSLDSVAISIDKCPDELHSLVSVVQDMLCHLHGIVSSSFLSYFSFSPRTAILQKRLQYEVFHKQYSLNIPGHGNPPHTYNLHFRPPFLFVITFLTVGLYLRQLLHNLLGKIQQIKRWG